VSAEEHVQVAVAGIRAEIDRLDPVAAAVYAQRAVEAWAAGATELSKARRTSWRTLRDSGTWTATDMAAVLGVSRQRVQQVIEPTTHTEEQAT
jgi:hypothetical protein